jgi:DNA ligase-1
MRNEIIIGDKENDFDDWEFMKDYNTSLSDFSSFCQKMVSTTSLKQKQIILKNNMKCLKGLIYVFNPYWHYQVTSERIKRLLGTKDYLSNKNGRTTWIDKDGFILDLPNNIFDLLDILKERRITGNDAVNMVLEFVKENRRFTNLILGIIDKNLKIRCDVKTINAVYNNLIPQFRVSLAEPHDKHFKKVNFEKDIWFASRKFDGVRVLCFMNEKGIEFRSREGNPFLTLRQLENQLSLTNWKGIVLDGEVCIIDDGIENFKKVVSEIKQKGHIIISPKFYIFDILTENEFFSGKSEIIYQDRLIKLQKLYNEACEVFHDFSNYITIVKQIKLRDDDHLQDLKNKSLNFGWEGLILRKNIGYEGKRSSNMLKVKKFQEDEFLCIGISETEMRIVEDEKEITIITLKNIKIDLGNGNHVDVGSGFTLEERKEFFQNPEKIIGKSVTINYFTISNDKNGKPSLRFPTFKCVHDTNKRDI